MNIIDSEYYKVKKILGHRPSRLELFENMDWEKYLEIKKSSKENIFKDYIGYLMSIDELNCDEKEKIDGFCWRFIKMIENTRMSKSYKMPFLLSFYNNGDLKSKIDDEDLYNSFKSFYSKEEKMIENTRMSKSYKMPFLLSFYNNGDLKSKIDDEDLYNSFKSFYSKEENTADMYADKSTAKFVNWDKSKYVDLARKNPVKYMLETESEFFEVDKDKIIDMYADKSTAKFVNWDKSKYVDLARKNPVKYMLETESEFFEVDKDKIIAKRLDEFKDNKFFVDNIKDAIDFRTREYYRIRYAESEFFEVDKDKIIAKRLDEFKDNKFFVDNIKDAIDFRTREYYRIRYEEGKDVSCIFCELKEYVLENELAFAIFDKFPVTKGHMLFIPKRHVANFFDLTKEEREASKLF